MDSPSKPSALADIEDDHRRVAFAFAQMLRGLRFSSEEDGLFVQQWLGREFSIDTLGVGGKHDPGVDLVSLVSSAAASALVAEDNDEKFHTFLDLITKKGYFADTTKGTPEYEARMVKAKERYLSRKATEGDAGKKSPSATAEQLKEQGNERMAESKYDEAVQCYAKAIELDSESPIYRANRAAAYLHLRRYRDAMIDCEQAIALRPTYAKAHARLGTAHFYEGSYSKATACFQRACSLEPSNEMYREDLRRAEEKLKEQPTAAAPMPNIGGVPIPSFPQMTQMMSNPNFMNMVQQMMSNEQLVQMMSSFAQQLGGNVGAAATGDSNTPLMQPSEDGQSLLTPFGPINREVFEQFRRDKIEGNPAMEAAFRDFQTEGFSAMLRHMGNPEIVQTMQELQQLLFSNRPNADAPNDSNMGPPL